MLSLHPPHSLRTHLCSLLKCLAGPGWGQYEDKFKPLRDGRKLSACGGGRDLKPGSPGHSANTPITLTASDWLCVVHLIPPGPNWVPCAPGDSSLQCFVCRSSFIVFLYAIQSRYLTRGVKFTAASCCLFKMVPSHSSLLLTTRFYSISFVVLSAVFLYIVDSF